MGDYAPPPGMARTPGCGSQMDLWTESSSAGESRCRAGTSDRSMSTGREDSGLVGGSRHEGKETVLLRRDAGPAFSPSRGTVTVVMAGLAAISRGSGEAGGGRVR